MALCHPVVVVGLLRLFNPDMNGEVSSCNRYVYVDENCSFFPEVTNKCLVLLSDHSDPAVECFPNRVRTA